MDAAGCRIGDPGKTQNRWEDQILKTTDWPGKKLLQAQRKFAETFQPLPWAVANPFTKGVPGPKGWEDAFSSRAWAETSSWWIKTLAK
jgi:hypothetical protein